MLLKTLQEKIGQFLLKYKILVMILIVIVGIVFFIPKHSFKTVTKNISLPAGISRIVQLPVESTTTVIVRPPIVETYDLGESTLNVMHQYYNDGSIREIQIFVLNRVSGQQLEIENMVFDVDKLPNIEISGSRRCGSVSTTEKNGRTRYIVNIHTAFCDSEDAGSDIKYVFGLDGNLQGKLIVHYQGGNDYNTVEWQSFKSRDNGIVWHEAIVLKAEYEPYCDELPKDKDNDFAPIGNAVFSGIIANYASGSSELFESPKTELKCNPEFNGSYLANISADIDDAKLRVHSPAGYEHVFTFDEQNLVFESVVESTVRSVDIPTDYNIVLDEHNISLINLDEKVVTTFPRALRNENYGYVGGEVSPNSKFVVLFKTTVGACSEIDIYDIATQSIHTLNKAACSDFGGYRYETISWMRDGTLFMMSDCGAERKTCRRYSSSNPQKPWEVQIDAKYTSKSTVSDKYHNWRTFSNSEYGFEFKYPPEAIAISATSAFGFFKLQKPLVTVYDKEGVAIFSIGTTGNIYSQSNSSQDFVLQKIIDVAEQQKNCTKPFMKNEKIRAAKLGWGEGPDYSEIYHILTSDQVGLGILIHRQLIINASDHEKVVARDRIVLEKQIMETFRFIGNKTSLDFTCQI